MFKALLSRLQAQDAEERERWIRALEDTVVRHNQLRWTASSGRIVGGVVGVKTGGGGGVVAGSPLSNFNSPILYFRTQLRQILWH